MFIETEATPNPATLKFLPGRSVLGDRTADFATSTAAINSPLAQALFGIRGVVRVFLGADFVTVTKVDSVDWQELKAEVLATIMDHYVSGRLTAEAEDTTPSEDVEPDDVEVVERIKELLDSRVRPAVATDGGDIVFQGFRDCVVMLHMQGACSGCPSSSATLKHGIENMLKHFLPEVVAVRQVDL